MSKIERKYLAHFINTTTAGNQAPVYEQLGKDLEEFSPEMSAQVERKQNILGQTSVIVSGYEKTGAVEPYYAEEGSGLFTRLQEIIDEGLTLEDVKTDVVEVKLWEHGVDGEYPAIQEEVYIAINSYGGDTTGYQIPFTLHFTGKKAKGIFDVVNKIFIPN